MLTPSWVNQGLNYSNPVTVLRIILQVSFRLPTASTVRATFGITRINTRAAVDSSIPQPDALRDSRQQWLLNDTWYLSDPTTIARVTVNPYDLRGRQRLEGADRLILSLVNGAESTGSVVANFSWRTLVTRP